MGSESVKSPSNVGGVAFLASILGGSGGGLICWLGVGEATSFPASPFERSRFQEALSGATWRLFFPGATFPTVRTWPSGSRTERRIGMSVVFSIWKEAYSLGIVHLPEHWLTVVATLVVGFQAMNN